MKKEFYIVVTADEKKWLSPMGNLKRIETARKTAQSATTLAEAKQHLENCRTSWQRRLDKCREAVKSWNINLSQNNLWNKEITQLQKKLDQLEGAKIKKLEIVYTLSEVK